LFYCFYFRMVESMGIELKNGCQKHVLLVDDNEINAEIAAIQLKDIGLSADWASDGAKAVEMFKTSAEYFYDLVIMDIMMPVMDGIEATGLIRGLERQDAADVPIIAVSANNYAGDYGQLMQNGVSCFLTKPYSKSKFQSTVMEQIEGETAEKII